jgi:hypothetical protein
MILPPSVFVPVDLAPADLDEINTILATAAAVWAPTRKACEPMTAALATAGVCGVPLFR